MKKLVLISFFKSNNIGDLILSDEIKSLFSKHDVTLLDFSSLTFVKENNVVGDLQYSKKINPIKSTKIYGEFCKLYKYVSLILKDYDYINNVIADSDCVIMAGGNMVMDLTKFPNYSYKFYRLCKMASKNKKRLLLLFVGMGPLKTRMQKYYAKKGLELCDYLSVRDENSKSLCENIGVKKTVNLWGDVVFLTEGAIKTKNKNKIGLNVFCNREKEKHYKGYLNIIEDLRLRLPEYEIILYSTEKQDYEDVYYVYNKIKSKKNVNVAEINNVNDLWSFYDELKLIIGTRMHSIILALIGRIPVIGIGWQDKVQGLYDVLKLDDKPFSREELAVLPKLIGEKAVGILDNYDMAVDKIDKCVSGFSTHLNNLFLDEMKKEKII